MSNDSPYHSLTSFDSHTKRFAVIAVAVLAAIALVYYLSMPGHGDPAAIPPDLGIAVRDHFKESEGREVVRMDAFNCDSFNDGGAVVGSPDAVVEVQLENRPARQEADERSSRWVALASYRGDRRWEISSLKLPPEGERPDPCRR